MRQLMLFAALMCLCGCSLRSFFGLPDLPKAPTPNPFTSTFTNNDWAKGLDLLFLWANAASVIVIAGCVAVLIWAPIPNLKKWAWVGITFAATMLGCGI